MTTEGALPWTVLTARRAELGLSERALRGIGFTRGRRGVYLPAGADVTAPDNRIAAVAATLPAHAAVGGWAAARVYEQGAAADGIETFDGGARWADGPRDLSPLGAIVPRLGVREDDVAPVLVCAARESRLVLRPDVRVFRSPVSEPDVATFGDARITTPVRTAFDLARLLPAGRAVVALDRLLHLRLVTVPEVAHYARERPRWRGVGRVAGVLMLADGGAESPQESLIRLLWVAAGLPRPRANQVVRTLDGGFVARTDLVDADAGVVGEYDGALHSGSARRSRDSRRHEALTSLGLEVVVATGADVATEARAAQWQARLRAAYRRARGRDGRRRREWRVTPS